LLEDVIKGSYQWYEIQVNIAYYTEFEKPKIVYPNICKRPEFTLDTDVFIQIRNVLLFHLLIVFACVLNSSVTFFLFRQILPKLRGDFYEPSYVFFQEFPIAEQRRNNGLLLKLLLTASSPPNSRTPTPTPAPWKWRLTGWCTRSMV
jgi:hypothetical protein